jgi:hypothetical protein
MKTRRCDNAMTCSFSADGDRVVSGHEDGEVPLTLICSPFLSILRAHIQIGSSYSDEYRILRLFVPRYSDQ